MIIIMIMKVIIVMIILLQLIMIIIKINCKVEKSLFYRSMKLLNATY